MKTETPTKLTLIDLILAYLTKNPNSTGYDITAYLKSLTRHSHQQVYRALNNLEVKQQIVCTMVPQDGKPDKKEYVVTTPYVLPISDYLTSDFSKTDLSYCITLKGILAGTSALSEAYLLHMQKAEKTFIDSLLTVKGI